MKILLATGLYPPDIGGPATYAKLLVEELAKRGIEVEVLPFRDVMVYPSVVRHVVYFWKCIILARKADVIFTQDPGSTGIPAVFAGLATGRKVIMRVAGDYAWEIGRQRFGVTDSVDEFQKKSYGFSVSLRKFIQALSVRMADAVFSPSRYFANLVSGWNGHRKYVGTIYNGIDLSSCSSKHSEKYSVPTIISAGRLVPWKGFDTLIKLMPKLPNWRLVIAGDGPEMKKLVSLSVELGVDDRVDLRGSLTQEELFSEISKAEVFVLLSTFESFSFQIVEVMHIGTPVVALNVGNLSEIITNGHDGILVDEGQEGKLVDSILSLYQDRSLRGKLVENAKIKSKIFSIKQTTDQLLSLIEEIKR